MNDLSVFLAAFDAIPSGFHRGAFQNRAYNIRKTSWAEGKAEKLVAEELRGTDYISLNVYRLPSGTLLKPCEMSSEKVIDFVG